MIVGIFGRKGLGKSTLGEYIAEEVAPIEIIFDVRNQFPIDVDTIALTFGAEEPDLFGYLEEANLTPGRTRIVVRPEGDLDMACDRLGFEVSQFVADYPDAHLAILIDDAGSLKPTTLESWNRFFRTSDAEKVWFILTVHRPVDLHRRVRALMNWWIVFRTTEPGDLDTIKERCGEEFAERCRHLAPREFWVWDDDTIDDRAKMRFFSTTAANQWKRSLDRPTVARV